MKTIENENAGYQTKSRMGHTQGPWVVGPTDARGAISVIAEGSRAIIEVRNPFGHDRHPDEIMANARVIAAAPELLEALLAIVEGGNTDCGTYWKVDVDDIEKARAAVARAKGVER